MAREPQGASRSSGSRSAAALVLDVAGPEIMMFLRPHSKHHTESLLSRCLQVALMLVIATCPGWCLAVHGHAGHGLTHPASDSADSCSEAATPAPVNEDDCVCQGALIGENSSCTIGMAIAETVVPSLIQVMAIDVFYSPLLVSIESRGDVAATLARDPLRALAMLQSFRC